VAGEARTPAGEAPASRTARRTLVPRTAPFVALALLSACAPLSTLTKPEGTGGWSTERRQDEIRTRAQVAGVPLAPAPEDESLPGDTPITLDDALELARTRSRRIAIAERELDISRERVWQARGRLLPGVRGSGRYSAYTSEQTTNVVFPPSLVNLIGGETPDVVIRQKDFATVNGTLRVPIDVFGELTKTLTAAQAGYRGERARLWATTLDEQLTVVRAYYDLLEAQRLRQVTELTLRLEREQLQHARAREQAGRLMRNEVLVVEVAVQDSEQRLLQRDIAIETARWTLNRAIGLPVDAPTTVADVDARPDLPTTDEARAEAHDNNPVIESLLQEQQRLDDLVHARTAALLPRFDSGATIDYSTATIVQPQRVGGGFVGFTWDVDTGGTARAELAEARIAADRQRLAIEAELRRLDVAVRTSRRAVEERLAALDTAETAVEQAEENLRIRRQQFDVGRSTSDDVLDAQALLSQQRATLATALYEAHVRRAELQQLMGRPLTER
jgi:outer membrane protein TolC